MKDISSKHVLGKMVMHRFMVESTDLLFESYKNILKTLQEAQPEIYPFGKYLAPQVDGDLTNLVANVDPPIYSRAPGFRFDLSVLLEEKNKKLYLDAGDTQSRNDAIESLRANSSLDETQSQALVSSLSREVALIEGPPGTGKSYIGVQIMRVLLAEKNRRSINMGPVLTITYTNHALDSFLKSLLDHDISNIVRMGARSKSEIIMQFQIDEICRNRKNTAQKPKGLGRAYYELKKVGEEAKKIIESKSSRWIDWGLSSVTTYLTCEFPWHYQNLRNPTIPHFLLQAQDEDEEWQSADGDKRKMSTFEQWIGSEDLKKAQKLIKSFDKSRDERGKKNKKNRNANTNTFSGLDVTDHRDDNSGYGDDVDHEFQSWLHSWKKPTGERSLEELKIDHDVWGMSKAERVILHDFWRDEIHLEDVEELTRLKKNYDQLRDQIDQIYNEERREILSKSDVIGITTSGAAKYHDLIRSIGPKIIICEEAGEVLEAHILSSLTPSVQHVILIGDHNQLRPKICTYKLSVESGAGKNYGLDVSLFERLVHGKNSCMKIETTQLLTQRRMRSEIAELIRTTIYPDLEDHPRTLYPDVRGVQSNVFFIDHRNPEDSMKSEFALQSHSNRFEVEMIVEMVKYFVRNGYSKSEQIAVLTPYLGQLMKIRDALSNSFMVVIDDRDNEAFADLQEEEDGDGDDKQESSPKIGNTSVASKKRLTQQVVLRTIDNYQGEEADIVIISLVRNSLNQNGRGSIGFLKSENRTNVLLSRARHGMYILGNAELMENESKMWAKVIQTLRSRQPSQVNEGFPLVCAQHPHYRNDVFQPHQFEEISPDGGCTIPCGALLKCGHICPYKCHPDDPNHVSVSCKKPCSRLHKCGHPCFRLCGDDCGECGFPVGNIELPCGHILENATCYQHRNRNKVLCETKVSRKLLKCEHEVIVECHRSIEDILCRKTCDALIPGCNHMCKSFCWGCQSDSIKANNGTPQLDENGHVRRTNHGRCSQICSRNNFCGHSCEKKCHPNDPCPGCRGVCIVSCIHAKCKLPCGTPCSVCAEKCNWSCEHQGNCELPCGVPCSRLPCNKRCRQFLECGHRCFGICGEKCPSAKFCVVCAPENVKNQVVDVIMQSTFAEVDWNTELMVVLDCDHVFTAETLDALLEMNEFYHGDGQGNWVAIKPIVDQPGDLKCCPNCRTPIKNICRYGRVVKKRILDIQNRKFLTTHDSRLKNLNAQLERVVNRLEGNRKDFIRKLNDPPRAEKPPQESEDEVLNCKLPEVTQQKHFEKLMHYYSIPPHHERLWNKYVEPLLASYTSLSLLISAATIPPYKIAYDAAVSSLYQKKSEVKIDELIANFGSLNLFDDSPATQHRRLRESLEEVGIKTPEIDRRIYLDAFLSMVNIQKSLFHEVSSVIPELKSTENSLVIPELNSTEDSSMYRESWLKFSGFLVKSIKDHLKWTDKIALDARYKRHSVLASLELAEFGCTVERFRLRNCSPGSMNPAMKMRIKRKCDKMERRCLLIRGSLRGMNLEHFETQCKERIRKILKDIQELRIAAENSGQLTKEEKLQITKAMSGEFRGSGHWYQCPNGHPYTIGECGMAMESSTCPDCGAAIGGGDHTFLPGNVHNTEYDAMGTSSRWPM